VKSIKDLLYQHPLLTHEYYVDNSGKTYRKAWGVQRDTRGIVAIIIDEDDDYFAFIYSRRMKLK
jgi:hypothetical protein